MEFESTEGFAKKMDSEDPLSEFRDRFYIPKNSIYLLGNSLGLLSKDSKESVNRIIDEWKELGIKGWLETENPWFYLAEKLGAECANLVGADDDEVIMTGTTTVNIHQLISTFYNPKGDRTKILADELNFPTDIYALKSQIEMKGLDPEEELVLVSSKDGRTLSEDSIVDNFNEEIDVALLPSVLYRSGQLLDMEYLTEIAHEYGIKIGFDCSHSVGVIPHEFDEWDVDFAVWCSYKYLNAGPGSSAFLYVNEKHFDKDPGLAGWFGYVKEKQFDLLLDFESADNAGGWQISSPSILGSAAAEGSLKIIKEAGIDNIRKKSVRMTTYLINLVDEFLSEDPFDFKIASPRDNDKRGGHVALEREEEAYRISEALKEKNVIIDFRPPNVIRMATSPLYNTYHEIWKVVQHIKEIIDNEEYTRFSDDRAPIS